MTDVAPQATCVVLAGSRLAEHVALDELRDRDGARLRRLQRTAARDGSLRVGSGAGGGGGGGGAGVGGGLDRFAAGAQHDVALQRDRRRRFEAHAVGAAAHRQEPHRAGGIGHAGARRWSRRRHFRANQWRAARVCHLDRHRQRGRRLVDGRGRGAAGLGAAGVVGVRLGRPRRFDGRGRRRGGWRLGGHLGRTNRTAR